MYAQLIKHKQSIILAFWIVCFLTLSLAVISWPLHNLHPYWVRLGHASANAAVVFFTLAMLPGMLKRFQVRDLLMQVQLMTMLFRRQFGITMYIFVVAHFLLNRLYPVIKFNRSLTSAAPFEIMGMLAFFLLTPLFFTSNDTSVRKLGARWKSLHRIVHVIIWLIMLHIAMQGQVVPATLLILLILIGDIASFVYSQKSRRT